MKLCCRPKLWPISCKTVRRSHHARNGRARDPCFGCYARIDDVAPGLLRAQTHFARDENARAEFFARARIEECLRRRAEFRLGFREPADHAISNVFGIPIRIVRLVPYDDGIQNTNLLESFVPLEACVANGTHVFRWNCFAQVDDHRMTRFRRFRRIGRIEIPTRQVAEFALLTASLEKSR